MNPAKIETLFLATVGTVLALLLCSGCGNVPAGSYANMVAYEPVRSPVQIDASASIEVVDTLSPETQRALRNYLGHSDAIIANYVSGVEQTIRNDLANSGLFSRIANDDSTKPDYQVKAHCEELYPGDFRVRITLTAIETATGQQVSSHTRENSVGKNISGYKLVGVLPGLVAALKADLVEDLTEKARRQQEQIAGEEAEFFTSASLSKLLASSDQTEFLARTRNRAIVAAKSQQLPAILRERKSDELSAFVVKIEQIILDLNHECEVAKDQAQQSVTSDGTARTTTPRTQTFLGISMDRLSAEKATALGFEPGAAVVLVTGVVPGGPADKAELKRDDVILSIDGQNVPSPGVLIMLVQSFPPNTPVSVKFRRAGSEKTTTVMLGARQLPAAEERAASLDELRGLAICYRERIELLKPILTALKEEIANRSR